MEESRQAALTSAVRSCVVWLVLLQAVHSRHAEFASTGASLHNSQLAQQVSKVSLFYVFMISIHNSDIGIVLPTECPL